MHRSALSVPKTARILYFAWHFSNRKERLLIGHFQPPYSVLINHYLYTLASLDTIHI